MCSNVKVWSLKCEKVKKAILNSKEENNIKTSDYLKDQSDFSSNELLGISYPCYSTGRIHRNYIDCIEWYGDLLLTKSVQNKILLWKPFILDFEKPQGIGNGKSHLIAELHAEGCDVWFLQFTLSTDMKNLFVGNKDGFFMHWNLEKQLSTADKVNIYGLFEINPLYSARSKRAKTTIRQIALSGDGSKALAVNDGGQILMYRKGNIII
ncbi:hypothetical protein ROZALSC1DRAFT_27567 [Rozella allomycis CSF55]|uniref:WD40 repeat-like protein n=1 Tax=Rozella allomycis (strain CSF55) TaxID=988480 RepID=A0A075AQZ6_ROZAC|nr:hypothetical protein O9G_001026 [Rozella allomycis CSF55]RKP20997.1 hypothetical protein ROZALSC1DRAFT_27567 [Rozella allomycis CSF55]|eukprot:EPZ31115.1 hypothetical protein O9G_001026 [Rozella allomycis CSF55]